MRIGQTNSLLPKEHWTCLLILLITLTTGTLTDKDVIEAPLGGMATFHFNVTNDMKVILTVWNKCPNQRVFVFSPNHGLNISDDNYAGRVSVKKSENIIILDKLQESDFVTYCFELTIFPHGSLRGKIKLVKTTENGEMPIMIIAVGCSIGLIVLCGIIVGVVCYKKKKSNSADTALQPGGLPSSQPSARLKNKKRPKNIRSQSEREMENEDNNYLNIT